MINTQVLLRLAGDRVAQACGLLLFVTFGTYVAHAQTTGTNCSVFASPAPVRAEGLTEVLGDVVLSCNGTPSSTVVGTYQLFLPVNVTNRVDANNHTTQAVLSMDLGSGLVPSSVPANVGGNSVSFSPVSVTVPPSGA